MQEKKTTTMESVSLGNFKKNMWNNVTKVFKKKNLLTRVM